MLRKKLIAELARNEHGLTNELAKLLECFHTPQSLAARGILIEDLRSYLARQLPKASIEEACLFGQEVAYFKGGKASGRMITIMIRAHQEAMKKLQSTGKQGCGDDTDDTDASDFRDGPGNQSHRRKKGCDDLTQ